MRANILALESPPPSGPQRDPGYDTGFAPRRTPGGKVLDLRFRALMRCEEWDSLPAAIQRRFCKDIASGQAIVFVGEVVDTYLSRGGWLLAQMARLVGGPLPLHRDAHVPSVVSVTADKTNGGQTWTRQYGRRAGFPQVVHSIKRFAGPTGLEEYVGRGVGMTLTVDARDGALIFRSAEYFFELGRWRLVLPSWLTPGAIYVTHAELPDGKFSFTLQIIHPRFGLLLRQMAIFREATP
ncbi:MAG TPA: DUF4166 domain-containing protein [Xanthobacteraceae bacterium]|jgi:hypothetical protein|nr:DUF4166 domain-containing protein [Xanthobacteraceae bacterium]